MKHQFASELTASVIAVFDAREGLVELLASKALPLLRLSDVEHLLEEVVVLGREVSQEHIHRPELRALSAFASYRLKHEEAGIASTAIRRD